MSKTRLIEYLTGFTMGVFLGFIIESAFIFVFNLLCSKIGWTPIVPSLRVILPFPFLTGLAMSKGIADLHLEDYP